MRLGRNLAAGDQLWLEAVTFYGGVRFDPLVTLGDDCNLSDRVHIACTNRVSIGDGLLCGSNVLITDHSHGDYARDGAAQSAAQSAPSVRPALRPLSNNRTVSIGRNVWLGDGVAVLAGASIGEGAILGANAVVTGDIPSFTIAAGAPARPLRRWSEPDQRWVPIDELV